MSDRDRRKFERVNLPTSAEVFVHSDDGRRVGRVVVLARGGMLVDTTDTPAPGTHVHYNVVDDSEGIRTPVQAVVRYVNDEGVGYEFENLDPGAAVEIGVILGKYYADAQRD